MRYIKDDGTLKVYLDKVLQKYSEEFPGFDKLKFLLVWFTGEKKKGKVEQGRVSLPGKRIKDLFGYDVILEINKDEWASLSKKGRLKLIFHELCHIKPYKTKSGELKIKLLKHDFELQRFKKELLTFGLDESEESFRAFLNEVAEKAKAKKKVKRKKGGKKK